MTMKKALFLDRDGVINVEKNYVYKTDDFEFIEGIFELTREAQDKGYLLIIITNQAGIGRGYYTEADFQQLTDWMVEQFVAKGVTINAVYFCPFHPEAGIGDYKKPSMDRKPNPGMLFQARDKYQLDLSQCMLIGDKMSDIQAGRNAGLNSLLLLSTELTDTEQSVSDYHVISSLPQATAWL